MNKSNDLAENRTDWAEDRTLMANERTFASWTGTGMGAIALALGFRAVFSEFEPTWLARLIASLPLIASMVLFFAAWRKACSTKARLNQHQATGAKSTVLHLITLMMMATALGTGFVLWTL